MEDENNLIAKKLAHFGMQNAISKKHFGGYVGSIIIFRKGISLRWRNVKFF